MPQVRGAAGGVSEGRFLAAARPVRQDPSVEPLRAERVVIARSVLDDPPSRARLDAMLPRVESGRIDVLDDDQVEGLLLDLGPRAGRPRGGLDGRGRQKELVAFARFGSAREVFPGYSWREVRNGRTQAQEHGVLCQTAIEVQSVVGCPFTARTARTRRSCAFASTSRPSSIAWKRWCARAPARRCGS